MTNRILVAAVFLVGCAVGGVSAQIAVPKASAQQAATLTKWEYKCDNNVDEDGANELGAERWEMVALANTSTSMKYCFKRPKM